ncbi:MAG TPA: hypothetical protein VGA37_16515 [Gemmatimonadales bacterium]
MKLFLIIVDGDHAADVQRLLDECERTGYSEIPTVLGKGATGRKLGTRAFPGSSTLYFAAVDSDCAARLPEALRRLRDQGGRDEGLKVYALDTTEVV